MMDVKLYHDGTLYVGAALSEGHIPGGLVIATDAGTGAVEWVFNTIPQRPRDDGWEIARDTWGDGQRAGGGVWTQPAIDLDLGLIYFNTGNPSPDYDGSARPGANLFTNATVALDLETGALRWYYQAIHHDLWDWDHVTGPVLFDVAGADGETIRGVGAAGKDGGVRRAADTRILESMDGLGAPSSTLFRAAVHGPTPTTGRASARRELRPVAPSAGRGLPRGIDEDMNA